MDWIYGELRVELACGIVVELVLRTAVACEGIIELDVTQSCLLMISYF